MKRGMDDAMSEPRFEKWLFEAAGSFPYPPTPEVADMVRRRMSPPRSRSRRVRLAWTALALLLLAVSLLGIPGVRAAVLEFFQAGAIRILPVQATPSPTGTAIPIEGGALSPAQTERAAPLSLTLTPNLSLLDLAGATTWESAQESASFSLRLPAYPPDLGPPDEVYQQRLPDPGMEDQQVFILVWRDPQRPEGVRLALYQIAASYYGLKSAFMSAIDQTEVGGEPAYWISEPHRIRLSSGEVRAWLFVPGDVLVWARGGITYRLEGAASMAEAVRIAESLQPVSETQ
jgi:hypothetical protein